MTFETLESLRLYIRAKSRADHMAADYARLNGYKSVALEKDNEAAMGDKILRELQNEYGEPQNARQEAYDQGR